MKIYLAILVFMLMKNTLTDKFICAIQISNEALIQKLSPNGVNTKDINNDNVDGIIQTDANKQHQNEDHDEKEKTLAIDKELYKPSVIQTKAEFTNPEEKYDEAQLKKIPALHIMGIYIKDEQAKEEQAKEGKHKEEVQAKEEEQAKEGKHKEEVQAKEGKHKEEVQAKVKEEGEDKKIEPAKDKEDEVERTVNEEPSVGKYKLDTNATGAEIDMGIKLMNAVASDKLKNNECPDGFEQNSLIGCAKKEDSIPSEIIKKYFNTLKEISASCRPLNDVETALKAIESVNVHYRELPKDKITTDDVGKVYADLLNNPAQRRLTNLKSDRALKVDNAKLLSEPKSSAFDLSSLLSIENLELRSPNLKIVSPMLLNVDNSRLVSII